jgi:hypothetical protein
MEAWLRPGSHMVPEGALRGCCGARAGVGWWQVFIRESVDLDHGWKLQCFEGLASVLIEQRCAV